jgi:hypothetical protein
LDNWQIRQKVDLANTANAPEPAYALASVGDKSAHTWSVEVLRNGAPADIAGAIVMGYFARPDGAAVVVQGRIEGSTAIVTMAQECYAIAGTVKAMARLARDDQTITLVTARIAVGPLDLCQMIDPGDVIPTIEDLLTLATVIIRTKEEVQGSIDAANTAAQNANAAARYATDTTNTAVSAASAATDKANAAAQNANTVAGEVEEFRGAVQSWWEELKDAIAIEDAGKILSWIVGAIYCVSRELYTVTASGWVKNVALQRYEYTIANATITPESKVDVAVQGAMIGHACLNGGDVYAGRVVLISVTQPQDSYDVLVAVYRQGAGVASMASGVISTSETEPAPATPIWAQPTP